MVRVVVVGNGVAGVQAALAVRAREPDWPITLVSEESDDLFSRTALMYVLCGQMAWRDICPMEPGTYERLRFTRARARATSVDVDGRLVHLAGGLAPLPYDALVLACGSAPRPAPWPGGDLRGVGHFVTAQDLAWLEREVHGGPAIGGDPPRARAHLEATVPGSPYAFREVAAERRGQLATRPVVIGGGLIGIEVVETLLAAGRKPIFLMRDDAFWPMALDAREAAWVADALRRHGVDVRTGQQVEALEGDEVGNVAAVRTASGRIDADLVVVAIGVVPNTGWLAGSAIARDAGGGLVVDAQLRTSAPGVWAAGDCASVAWWDGRSRPEQLWYTARDQGRIAGANVLGDGASYVRGTWYNSAKLMDVEYTTVGLVGAGLPGEADWFHEETGRVRSTTRIVHVGGRVVGFNFLGRRWDNEVLARWLAERRSLGWVVAHLTEASFDTEFVPALKLSRSVVEAAERASAPRGA